MSDKEDSKTEFYRYGRKHETHLNHERSAEKENFSEIKKMGILEGAKKILVVGCPNTFFIELCKGDNIDAVGVDIDPDIIDEKTVLKCDVEKERFPFDDDEFDVVYSKGLIQHLEKPPINFMKEISRVTKSDGRFVMLVRNEKSIPNMISIWDNYKHKSTWTPMSVKRMLKDFGFDIVHINPRFNFSKARGLLTRMPFKWKLGSTIFVVGKKK